MTIVTDFCWCCKYRRRGKYRNASAAVRRTTRGGFFCLTGHPLFLNIQTVTADRIRGREEDWEFGDAWKEGSPDDSSSGENIRYVDILRGDTGRGFDDSLMLDLVGYLGSFGIRATYESFSLGMEPAAIKTYVLMVEEGKEKEAIKLLEQKDRR